MEKAFKIVWDKDNTSLPSMKYFHNIKVEKKIEPPNKHWHRPEFVCKVMALWGDSPILIEVGTNVGYAEIDGKTFHGAWGAEYEPVLIPWEWDGSYGKNDCNKNALIAIAKMFDEKFQLDLQGK